MSWWVYLNDGYGETVPVENHAEGGTYALGGVPRAELNVTYNYGRCYREAVGHNLMDFLQDKEAGETLDTLRAVVEKLGTEQTPDYWEPTPGNAGHAAAVLLKWAEQHPDAMWDVS